jgi:hypothetical protein
MKGMSEREYAAHSGLSRGGVQKARKNGRLVVHDEGSINAAASDLRRAEMTDPDQQRRSLGGDQQTPSPLVKAGIRRMGNILFHDRRINRHLARTGADSQGVPRKPTSSRPSRAKC